MNTDFSKGPVWKNIIRQAIPLIIAQLVHLLYNVVDRIYIGHMESGNSLALTGVGLTFPIVTLIMAFSALFGAGATPLFSIARGAKEEEKAERIMGNACFLLTAGALVLTVVGYVLRRPILFLFGASETSYVYAEEYLNIYLLGTVFSMLTTGLNGFINAQGFPKIGMLTTVLGSVLNLVLDPLFIFTFDMGVSGAALATILSQAASAAWVLRFLSGPKALLRLQRKYFRFDREISRETIRLGTASFIMQGTNCLVQVVCNSTLQIYGGDLYVGVMTVINSIREITTLPISGLNQGAQPVMGFNYGAKEYGRVKAAIRFNALLGFSYTILAWLRVLSFPKLLCGIFTTDPEVLIAGPAALNIYFFGFCFMAFQFCGQSVFQALGYARYATFFSLLRKAIIVAPLTLILPRLGFGVNGVFMAEPISNVIGGLASFLTMRRVIYKKL